jgi:hypothetical protein
MHLLKKKKNNNNNNFTAQDLINNINVIQSIFAYERI